MVKKSVYLILIVMVLTLTACSSPESTTEATSIAEATLFPAEIEVATDVATVAPTAIPPTATLEPIQSPSLELSADLLSGCERNDGTDPNLSEGDTAVEFSVLDVNGNSFVLSDLLKEKPVALIYGSFT